MNNSEKILQIDSSKMHRIIFVTDREEGGINSIFDPESENESFQVFIHNRFPYRSQKEWHFDSFEDAREFAATEFADEKWEVLSWDQSVTRPCQARGEECGKGNCEECKKGGGCSTCGASELE